jgi:hypothetical protein
MKKKLYFIPFLLLAAGTVLFTACSPISLTSWKNPKENQKVSRVVVWGMFDRLEYQKPFEQVVSSYFNNKGLKSMEALTFLDPNIEYELPALEKMFDSIGADGILLVTYTGTDKEQTYVQPTATFYPDYYYSYYGYYSWGYPLYGPGYAVGGTEGYWATTTVVNLRANLYANSDNALLWTAAVSITDPEHVDQVSYGIAEKIFSDWMANGLIVKKSRK